MKNTFLMLLLTCSASLSAQDTTSVEKAHRKYTHQIGFNGTLLIKQLISDNPASTLTQLPYQLDYTLGFGNKWAARFGLGFDQSLTNTTIQGQSSPRTTSTFTADYRLDVVRKVMSYKRFSSGIYFGGIMDQANLVTKTTTDQSSVGGPITTNELSSKSSSYGCELGIGIKFSFNEHIGIGTEMPFQVKETKTSETDKQTTVSGSFSSFNQTITETNGFSSKIFLPTSLFILVTF